jgi:hypothetical protein
VGSRLDSQFAFCLLECFMFVLIALDVGWWREKKKINFYKCACGRDEDANHYWSASNVVYGVFSL